MNLKSLAVFVAVLSRHTRSGVIRRGPRARGFSSGFLGDHPLRLRGGRRRSSRAERPACRGHHFPYSSLEIARNSAHMTSIASGL